MASAAEQLAANISLASFSKATDLKKRLWFTLGVVVVFTIIFIAGLIHLRRAPNLFQFLLVAGCLLLISMQAIINLGVVTSLLFLVVCLSWGTTWLGIKIAVESVPPLTAAGLRFLIAFPLFLGFAAWRREPLMFPKGSRWFFLFVTLAYFSLPYYLLNYGEMHVSSGLTALLFSCMPVFILIFTALFLRERIYASQVLGIAIGFASLFMIIRSQGLHLDHAEMFGVLAILTAAILHALCYVVTKKHGSAISVAHKARLEAILCQRDHVGLRQRQGPHGLFEVRVEVATEIGRIVRIDGGAQARVEQLFHRVVGQVVNHAEFQVGQRTHGQRRAAFRQFGHQHRVLQATHTVVDAFGLQQLQRFPDVFGRTFFACVRDDAQTQFTAAREHAHKLLGRMVHLAGIQPHADEVFAVRQSGFQRGEGFGFAQVAQETQDQRRTDAQLALRVGAGA